MNGREVRSGGTRERANTLTVAGLVLGAVVLYLVLRAPENGGDASRNLLPYQTLARTLTESQQQMYTAIRRGLTDIESDRARTSRWPEPLVLAANQVSPFASAAADRFEWQRFQQGATVQYFGRPEDPAAPGWILAIQEPEPNAPPDPAPNDDEHHRLPDGTTLHIYVWTHQFGGRVSPAFIPQPQNDGWTEVFAVPPSPLIRARTP